MTPTSDRFITVSTPRSSSYPHAPDRVARQRRSRRGSRAGRAGLAGLAAAIVVTLSACGTFGDSDAVARVGDERLTNADYEALLAATVDPQTTAVERTVATDILNAWVLTELLDQELAARGLAVTDDDLVIARDQLSEAFGPDWATTQPPVLRDLQIRQTAVVNRWSATDVADTDTATAALVERYGLGPDESGVICSAHILVADDAAAAAILERLDEGEDFAELARLESLDEGSVPGAGFLGCQTVTEFTQMFVPPFAEAALAAPIGVPIGPVATEFGSHVIVLPSADQAGYAEAITAQLRDLATRPEVRFRQLALAGDVRIDPRYGTFDPDQGVIALG